MTPSSDSPRALIRYGLVGLALTVAISWTLYEVRDALVLVYISALVAIGLSPLVNSIERRHLLGRRVPRWGAILIIYLCIIGAMVGVGALVIPALVTQARGLANELPRLLHQGQVWLIDCAWLGGQLLLGTIIGSTAALGLFLLGVSFFYVLALLGVLGVILAVPTAAIIQVLFEELVFEAAAD